MKHLFKTTWVGRISVMSLHHLISIIIEWLDELDLEALHLKEEADAFKAVFADFEKAVRQNRKTGFTEELQEMNIIRTNIVQAMVHILEGQLLLPDKKKARIAQQVIDIVKKHSSYIPRLGQLEKTGAINSLLNELQNEIWHEPISQLDLDVVITQLSEYNQRFEDLYIKRIAKQSKYQKGLTLKMRKSMEEQFQHLCGVIESHAIIEGVEKYQSLINRINTEVAEVKKN